MKKYRVSIKKSGVKYYTCYSCYHALISGFMCDVDFIFIILKCIFLFLHVFFLSLGSLLWTLQLHKLNSVVAEINRTFTP